jgi:hypothetical protein
MRSLLVLLPVRLAAQPALDKGRLLLEWFTVQDWMAVGDDTPPWRSCR